MLKKAPVLLFFCLCILYCSEREEPILASNTPCLHLEKNEASKLVKGMTLQEKLGQLIFLQGRLHTDFKADSIIHWSSKNMLGGIILQDATLYEYINAINRSQRNSKIKILTGSTEQVSLCNQFKKSVKFPSEASVCSIANDSLSRIMNSLYQEQLKALNIDFVLGPEFGEIVNSDGEYNCRRVSNVKAFQRNYNMQALRKNKRNGILSFANSFEKNIENFRDSLVSTEEMKNDYAALCRNGLQGILVDSILFAKDPFIDRPRDYIKFFLKDEFGFAGLSFAKLSKADDLKRIFYAGADAIFVNGDVQVVMDTLASLYATGILTDEILNDKVARIGKYKNWVAKTKRSNRINYADGKNLIEYKDYGILLKSLYDNSNLILNNNSCIPLTYAEQNKIKFYEYSKSELETFKKTCRKYVDLDYTIMLDDEKTALPFPKIKQQKHITHVFILNGYDINSLNDQNFIEKLNSLADHSQVLIVNFDNPFNFAHFGEKISQVHAFESNNFSQESIAELIFGAISSNGKSNIAFSGTPIRSQKINSSKLQFVEPEEVNIDSEKLIAIDSIVEVAIAKKAIPGAQLIAVKNGKVFYSKSFGYHTYQKKQKVSNEDLYDLASLSKISSTALAVMRQYDQKSFGLDDKLKNHLALTKNTKLKNISISNLLLHRSNLQPNMPLKNFVFLADTILSDCEYKFCSQKRSNADVEIADNFWFNSLYQDSLWQQVLDIKPYKQSKYRYSDVNFNLLQKLIESKSGQNLDKYVKNQFYYNLGLRRIGYNPRERFDSSRFPPTAYDKDWRKQMLRGYVHDEYTALQGGVAGSAGLFSNAEDLAVIFQMLLNGGTYAGRRFLNEKTIDLFTSAPFGNKRGLGFDKPRGKYTESCSTKASKKSYGHSGFTGTCVWVDPEEELIFIFLSNRIHPDINNGKLFREKYRGKIHTVLYEALDTYKWKFPNEAQSSIQQNLQVSANRNINK